MSTFRFRLSHVLEWYRKQSQLEKDRLAACLAQLNQVREARVNLDLERHTVETEVIHRASMPSTDLVALGLYRLGVKKRHMELSEAIQQQEAAVAAQTLKYLKAERQVKLIEHLRERRRADHKYAEERELEAVASDSYMATWVRNASQAASRKEDLLSGNCQFGAGDNPAARGTNQFQRNP